MNIVSLIAKRRRRAPAVLVLAVCAAALAACGEDGEEDDAVAAGRDVFRRCQACHVPSAEQNRVGPHLLGLFGRQAGSVADFRYSQAMRDSGLVWDEQTLSAYLRDPRGYIPGNRMAFSGLGDEQAIDNLIAYLRQATDPNPANDSPAAD